MVLDENVISTPNPVDFRFGASVGHGRELRIVLAPSTEPTGKHRGPNFGGVQTIQLLHDVEMHLQTGSAGFLPGDQPQNYTTVARRHKLEAWLARIEMVRRSISVARDRSNSIRC